MTAPTPETIYDSVVYQYSHGTLKLNDEQLSFHTDQKVSVLPWKKVVRRQVTSAASNISKPMFKLILKSGNEAVFQMEDRISLEVLRDDLGERLKTWRKLHPEPEEDQHVSPAINKTRCSLSSLRQSTPYRMVSQRLVEEEQQSTQRHSVHTFNTMPQAPARTQAPVQASQPKHRRVSAHVDHSTRSEPDPIVFCSSSRAKNARRRASEHGEQSTRSAPDPLFRASMFATTTTAATTKPNKAKPASIFSSSSTVRKEPPTKSPSLCRTNSGDYTVKHNNRRGRK